jgi:hypothetical protein
MKKKNKVIAVSIADANNLKYFEMMKNSLRKWHTEEELPLALIGPEQLKDNPDQQLFYRFTPVIGNQFLNEGFDTVIKLDADQVITGKLNHLWEDADFDVAVVQNSNPKEMAKYPVSVWDIDPLGYVNCGMVVMRSKAFVQHWLKLCFSPHFDRYQMKEQDLLNIMVHYGDYKVKSLDNSSKWHGLIWKGYEIMTELKDGKLILPKNESWPQDEEKEIVCWHVAGGNVPNKMNYNIRFKPDVAKWIDKLVKP